MQCSVISPSLTLAADVIYAQLWSSTKAVFFSCWNPTPDTEQHAHVRAYQRWEKGNRVPVRYKQVSDLSRGSSLQAESQGQIVFQAVNATS